jgi:hypothetical protein
MQDTFGLYLFGDQTHDFAPELRQLLRIKDSPLLTSFLERTHIALRKELACQNREIRELVRPFSNVVDLLAAFTPEAESAPILASTLAVAYHLGSFIR